MFNFGDNVYLHSLIIRMYAIFNNKKCNKQIKMQKYI